MTDQTKGLLFIIGGCVLLLLAFDFIVEGALFCLGLWLIDRGMRLRKNEPLFEKIRRMINAL